MSDPGPSATTSEPQTCEVCYLEKDARYKCPNCKIAYCSVKCYRGAKHRQCSEQFYKSRLDDHLNEGSEAPGIETFDERMKKYLDGDGEDVKGLDPEEADGELVDSDDEGEDEYLKKVLQDVADEYDVSEDELDRRLLKFNLGGDADALLESLTEEERKAFAGLAQQIHDDEAGLGKSCFRQK
ncbi:unnamed protein product, partial [Mesorhabditis spiculigera]